MNIIDSPDSIKKKYVKFLELVIEKVKVLEHIKLDNKNFLINVGGLLDGQDIFHLYDILSKIAHPEYGFEIGDLMQIRNFDIPIFILGEDKIFNLYKQLKPINFNFDSDGYFVWLNSKQKLGKNAERYLKELLSVPNCHLDISNKSEEDRDKYRTNLRESAIKSLIQKFKQSGANRVLINSILEYSKSTHWINIRKT